MSDDNDLTELSEAARRAGYIVTEQIDSILERAEQQAEAIRREAVREAEDTRREAMEAAQRLLGRLEALEFPLGSLVASLRDEAEHVSRQIESGSRTVDTHGTALPSAAEEVQAVAEEIDEPTQEHTVREVRDEEGRDEAPEAEDEDFSDDAHGEAPHPPSPRPDEQPVQTAGDWQRWIVEDEDEDPLGQVEEPAGAIGSPHAPSHDDGGRSPRFRGRRRAEPRS